MSNYGYTNPFSICFTTMKHRYSDYDASIDKLNFVNRDDKVNVFINFESVLNNLSMIKDIDSKLLLERNFPIILESEAINLCAHYKRFFRDNGLPTRVFLYYTDLESDDFRNFKYNDEYRSYYINKYVYNPKYYVLGNKMITSIIPEIKKIMEFIPDTHFITAKNIDSSLVPYIISKKDESYKNFIVTMDKYDSQYLLYKDKFCTHYLKRSPNGSSVFTTIEKLLENIFNSDTTDIMDLFMNSTYYSLLVGIAGDKPRSIDPIKGVGIKTILKFLSDAIKSGNLSKTTTSINMIKDAIPPDISSDMGVNFNCVNIDSQYKDLTEQDIFGITNQIIDRFDFNSLLELNRTTFQNYPLMLNELTQ